MKYEFKPFDKVLVRDAEEDRWRIDIFEQFVDGELPYSCLNIDWRYFIPYEGNEHLLGTKDKPTEPECTNEQPTQNENVLFGVELKPGCVLEFERITGNDSGIIFPTANGLAICSIKSCWSLLRGLNNLEKENIIRIHDISRGGSICSGEVLWERPKPRVFTKAQIAEKLGLNENEFAVDCE